MQICERCELSLAEYLVESDELKIKVCSPCASAAYELHRKDGAKGRIAIRPLEHSEMIDK